MISNRYVLEFSSTCCTDILQPPMADRNLLLVKDELCPTASFLNWVRLRCQLALIFKYKKDVCTFPQRDSTCWNLCNKMGSSDSGNMARFCEDKIVLSRNLHTKVNCFPPFPHVHGVFCAGKNNSYISIWLFYCGSPKNGVGDKHLDCYYGRFIYFPYLWISHG